MARRSRKPLSRKSSRRSFKRGMKRHRRNSQVGVMRGGLRI